MGRGHEPGRAVTAVLAVGHLAAYVLLGVTIANATTADDVSDAAVTVPDTAPGQSGSATTESTV
ncbi:hypothetical protein GCM10010360_18460 [Streptomyces nogalater]